MARLSVRRHRAPAVAVAVSFGEGKRPEHAARVRFGRTADTPPVRPTRTRSEPSELDPGGDSLAFEGPLALLLSLIEARQLDVLTVPLGGLAGAYLEALAGLEGERLPYLSAFVAVAAQLILIKSRALLPRQPVDDPSPVADEGPDPEAELRRRLIVYRAYRDAGQWLLDRSRLLGPLVRREPSVAQAAGLTGARPPAEPPLDPAVLEAALRGTARVAPPSTRSAEVVHRTITLAERADIIRAAIIRAPVVVLQDLLGQTADREVAAVTFLAMLELVKRREIAVEQERPWGPIRCRALARAAVAAAAVPIDESLEDFA
ncbi:MAG TPA: ScpA family protein [Candidatus Acidoferrales bacterium]|nr:ScpA family protein [Candidatus Acidoferrales bacterium]